ncbi:MAG: cytochrome B5 [Thermoleophilia bacterium]|nr:cytochrome B5 [Thermoleophilia bacterium]
MKKFTLEELKEHNGRQGTIYVAFKGKVYDLTESYLWEDGLHQDLHEAGMDLSKEMAEAPHDEDLLRNFPVIGELDEGGSPGGGGQANAFGLL